MRLFELREERNLTQDDVAKAINTSRTNIGRWEKGINEPSSSFIIQLADFFNCSTDFLLGRADDFGVITIPIKKETPPLLTDKEKELLDIIQGMESEYQAQILEYARYIAERRKNANTHKRINV